ncbi:sucrase ferredoxin [Raineyella sp. LH-20]|uniref:sucrase ferredoxin n=1 Tax=Raineyella sp. LH-20 TaxID=3081204 RepID=UPI002953E5D2|nr:sucrase ferredoxin [Raineyella sp. LH-20]WOP18208.1 sucrase ferredoxin [Raineyella sp. LH-20]
MDRTHLQHPHGSTERCALRSVDAGEQAAGTAAEAVCWVVLEQDGPWGAKAATQSRLDPQVGARLDAAVSAVGGRFALMREPGAHPDRHLASRRVIVSGGPADRPWLVRGTVAAPERLLELPVDTLADPTPDRLLAALPELAADPRPVLLVCTNGKRDQCCALDGRPLAAIAHRAAPGRVVETTHLGGHRFAPTATVLPYGVSYARLDQTSIVAALHAADLGRIPAGLADAAHYRGRSCLQRPQQAAELAQRRATGDLSLPGPPVQPAGPLGEDRWRVTVGAGTDRTVVEVTRTVSDELRPESCGTPPVPVAGWHTRVVD